MHGLNAEQQAAVVAMREQGAMVAEIAHALTLQYWQVREFLCTTPGLSFLVR